MKVWKKVTKTLKTIFEKVNQDLKNRNIKVFTAQGRLISVGSIERQFSPDVYISLARTALCSPSPSLFSFLLSSDLQKFQRSSHSPPQHFGPVEPDFIIFGFSSPRVSFIFSLQQRWFELLHTSLTYYYY